MKKLPQQEKMDEAFFPITVAVVTYNHGTKLKNCIDSIAKQTYQYIDLVIVDDFSCDFDQREVEKYVRDLNSESIQSVTIKAFDEHRGINAAYRHALECAKGEYVLFLGGDDHLANKTVLAEAAKVLMDTKVDILQAQAQLLRAGEKIIIPSQQCINFVKENKIFDLTRVTVIHPFSQLLCIQSAFFRRECLMEQDAFTGDYQFSADWPLYLKLLFDKAEFLELDLLTTLMNDGGAYRANSVGNVYIKKGYLSDAKRAIREFAIENRPGIAQQEALMFETAANSYEVYSTRAYDWYYYSFEDKIAWKKKHKDLYLNHKACYPDFGGSKLPLKKLIAGIALVFVLIALVSTLPAELQVYDSRVLCFAGVVVAAYMAHVNKIRTGAFFTNFNYNKLAILLSGITGSVLVVRTYDKIYVPYILLIIMGVLTMIAALDICYRAAYKLYCRYAKQYCRKE